MKDLDNIYTYHKPSALQSMKYDMIRAYAKQLADAIETVCPDSRERSLAHTNLEQATMWANASIARYKDPEPVASPFHVPPGSVKAVLDEDPPFIRRHTNFSELTKSPESLAEFLSAQPYCGRGEVVGDCNEDCYPCVLKWLNEEVGK